MKTTLGIVFLALVLIAGAMALDLSSVETGAEPPGVFVIEGSFKVSELDGERVVEMGTEPAEECMMLFGDTLRGGATVRAKIKAGKKGRSYPSFGVGLYGVSGYRLRVAPSRKALEIVDGDEAVASREYAWGGDGWTWVELGVASPEAGRWVVEGRSWDEDSERPEEAMVRFEFEDDRVMGKAAILATPYTGMPTYFGELEVVEEE
ncbi:MAG: hypothetical protein AAF591_13530 [Verrucomicrobiota bacterium]